jgi:predicted permease
LEVVMLQDLKHAVRLLLQTKGWTAVVLLSLALGIGANTALFSGLNALFLRTISVPHPETLVRVRYAGANDMRRSSSTYNFSGKNAAGEDIRETTSYPIYQSLRSANQTLTDIAASAPMGSLNAVVDGKAELATAFIASGNYFQIVGVPAHAGRTLQPEDDIPSAPQVAVISYGYWQKRFGGEPSVIGRAVSMNNTPVTIVGVMPQGFTGVQSLTDAGADITLPLALDPQFSGNTSGQTPRLKDGTWWWLQMVGRLKPGVTFEQVRGNLDGTFQAASRETWTSYLASIPPDQRSLSRNQNRTAVPHLEVDSASRGIYDADNNTRRSATALSVVVGLMLVIVCANVANLLLSRAAVRHKEISVRLSLGATRVRIVRQLLTESVLLAVAGGALGLLVGYWSRQLLPFAQTAPLDWRVFGFVASLCLMTGIAFGLFPALRATRVDLSGSMKETSRNVTRSRTFLSKSLLIVQVAISLVVLIGAGLFLRTMQNLRNVEVGFNTRNLVIFSVNPRLNGYDAVRVASLYDQIHASLKAVPGVRAVSHSQTALLSGSSNQTSMFIQGKPANGSTPGGGHSLWQMTVSPEFMETLEIPLVRGRNLDVRDTLPKAPQVSVINESAAKQYFPGEDPIGKRYGSSLEQNADVEIVGIVKDTKYASLRDAAPPTAFRPFAQQTTNAATFEVRTFAAAESMIAAVREAIGKVDANLPLIRVSTQTDLVEGRFTQERFFAMAYSLFGGLGLLLAAIGLFGLMSYNVARRTNEIGIRMALGAQRQDVVQMVLRESLIMVAVGTVIGISAALAAGRLVATMLFGLAPHDVVTIVVAIGVLATVSLLAGYLPARRASRVDPMVALHYE